MNKYEFSVLSMSIRFGNRRFSGLSVGTEKHCVFGHLGLVSNWSCFVFCILFLTFYDNGGVGAVVRSLPSNPKDPGSIPGFCRDWNIWRPSFPLKFTQLSILPRSVK